jgi:uncharacterized membrane protein
MTTSRSQSALWLAVALVLLSFSLCLFYLGDKSLWLDEAVVATYSQNWSSMWEYIRAEGDKRTWLNMPLLYFLQLFGKQEFWLRLHSAFASVITLPVVVAVGHRIGRWRYGFIAALILALNPTFIHYAKDAKGYALLMLLCAVATYLFIRAVQTNESNAWVIYGVVSALSVAAHLFALIVIACHFLSLAFRDIRKLPYKNIIRSILTLGFLLLGNGLLVALDFSQGANIVEWLNKPTIATLLNFAHFITRFPYPPYFYVCVGALTIILAISLLVRKHKEFWPFVVLVICAVLPIVSTYIASYTFRPIFLDRYLLICLIPFVLVIAVLVSQFRSIWISAILGALFAFLPIRELAREFREPREDWRSAVAHIVSNAREGDYSISFPSYTIAPMNWYLDRFIDNDQIATPKTLRPVSFNALSTLLPAKDITRIWFVVTDYPPNSGEERETVNNFVLEHCKSPDVKKFPVITITSCESISK